MQRPFPAAIGGLALAAPIGLLLVAVLTGIEPLEAGLKAILMGPNDQPNTLGRAYMLAGLVLLIPAFVVAAWPMLRRGADGRRHVHVANLAAMAVIGVLIVATWGGLAQEVVRCDVMGIPNCD